MVPDWKNQGVAMNTDKRLEEAIVLIRKNLRRDGMVSKPVSMVQRHLKVGYAEALSIVGKIESMNIFKRNSDA